LESFGLGAQGLTAQARAIASNASAMGQLFAAPVIAVVPVVILWALIEKHLVGGLTAGSVK
jgi:ABC-type glycerol-3-phosphate transport system permease component